MTDKKEARGGVFVPIDVETLRLKMETASTTPTQPVQQEEQSSFPWWVFGVFAGAIALALLAFLAVNVGKGLNLTASQPTTVPVIGPTIVVVAPPTQVIVIQQPTPVNPPANQPSVLQPQCYPLNGQQYSSPQGSKYDALWTCDGRLWQPWLPEGNLRVAHTVAITLEVGNYAFDAVECALYVDATRNGKGASNPMTVGYGNDLRFSVNTADNGQAWALVECRGNFSTGFQIRFLGQ